MSTTLSIIDPHIHLWDPYHTPRRVSPLVKTFGKFPNFLDKLTRVLMPKAAINFVGQTQYVLNPYLPTHFYQDTGRFEVKGYVHIQAGWEGKHPLSSADETKWLTTLEKQPLAIIGEAHLHDLKNLDAVLDAHAQASPLFKGVRDMLAYHPDKGVMDFNAHPNMLTSADFKKGYARLAERNLTFDTFLFSHQIPDFIRLVTEVPQTKVVLNHVGTPVGLAGAHGGVGVTEHERTAIQEQWYENLAKLAAECPHVHIKLSGLLMPFCGFGFEKRTTPASLNEVVDSIGPHITYALQTFGVDRCMFASNFPMDKVSTTYETLYTAYFKIVEEYSIADQQQLFASNAKTFYDL